MRTDVVIIGGGPAGILLSQALHLAGIDCVVLEARSRAHVESRIRAGVLEMGTVDMLERVGAADRLHRERLVHDGCKVGFDGEILRIHLAELTAGATVTIYGQTEVTKDLIALALERGTRLIFEAGDVMPCAIDGDAPYVTCTIDGEPLRIDCRVIAGCDGYHGVCRSRIPAAAGSGIERAYPFGWLGILADVPPCSDEIIYSNHARGFAMVSMRSPTRSRYYIQCPIDEDLAAWPDERIWDELASRLGPAAAERMVRGPSIEKSIAPLRSFVFEKMRYGRLFLAGDAAHIVPPTGAKGLNLAVADIRYLSDALITFFRSHDETALDAYAPKALARVWKAERFSWWFTSLVHQFPNHSEFDRRMQRAEFDYLRGSRAAQTVLAENYVGLAFS